mmetsp:Transcript_3260/g.6946  ORF Transcript_3260/g.6946 Transcript_3260/m.6946 type:complete len:384 (-) Transcript_3260:26-1177(-)
MMGSLCTLMFLATMSGLCSSLSVLRRNQIFAPQIRLSTQLFHSGTRAERKRPKTIDDSGPLCWETFEFGDSPKWDRRFDASSTIVASNEEELDVITQKEAQEDKKAAHQLNSNYDAWRQLDPGIVQQATGLLRPYVNDERFAKIENVLKQRTRQTRFLFEDPVNPSNVWACLRTLDSFGIQYVDLVITSGRYLGKAALSQKRGMRTAMGSAQWLTLRNHQSTEEAIEKLKSEGYSIYASDLNPESIDIRQIDWSQTAPKSVSQDDYGSVESNIHDSDRPICIVMGNEERGISEEMRKSADMTFTLPMAGFAESFNLSVATAITLAHLSASSTSSNDGPLRPGNLSVEEYDILLLKGLLNTVNSRTAKAILKQHGIDMPATKWL